MQKVVNILDLGKMEYQSTWDIQKEYHQKVLSKKEPDTLIIVEHEPVYTFGKNSDQNHLLQSAPSLSLIHI